MNQLDPYHSTPSPPSLPPALPTAIGDDGVMRMLLPVGRSGWAIAAGYLGLISLIILPAPFALIVSLIAIWHIRQSRLTSRRLHGMGRAIFGLIMGVLGTAVLIYFVVRWALR